MFFNEDKEIGTNLVGVITPLAINQKEQIEEFLLFRQFSEVEAFRFRFCLMILNLAHAIWWVNLLESNTNRAKRIIDSMVETFIGAFEKNQEPIRIGDLIVDPLEVALINNEMGQVGISKNTMTNYRSIVPTIYNKRVAEYFSAFKEIKVVLSKEGKSGFSPSLFEPLAKYFVRHFTGESWEKHAKFVADLSSFLTFWDTMIHDIVKEWIKPNIKQESVAGSKFFKSREEYEAWKAGKLKEAEEKRKRLIDQYYQVLGLKPNASKEDIEQAYKDLLTVWNPDAFADEPGLQQKAREKVKEIDEAYKKLMLHLSKRDDENTRQGNIQLKDKVSVNDINTTTIEQERIVIRETDSEQTKTEEQKSIKVSIDEIKEEINGKRATIANLSEEIANLKRELSSFEAEYHARVGVLYVRLDELELKLREYSKRIKLLKSGKIDNLVDLEKIIEEQFQKDKEKINKEKEEAEQYTEEYEAVKEKPKLGEESEKKLKSLYRELAKKYHPDMARTPEEKERYNKIMAEINQAYNDKDLGKLEELAMRLKIPEKTFFKETIEEEIERLIRESEKLDDIISRLKDGLAVLKSSDTYKFKMRADESIAQGRDLLKELEDNLKAKIEQRDEELEWVKREFRNLSKDLA